MTAKQYGRTYRRTKITNEVTKISSTLRARGKEHFVQRSLDVTTCTKTCRQLQSGPMQAMANVWIFWAIQRDGFH